LKINVLIKENIFEHAQHVWKGLRVGKSQGALIIVSRGLSFGFAQTFKVMVTNTTLPCLDLSSVWRR
jgi:hypothetical protein